MSISKKSNGKWEVRWREGSRRHGRTFDRKTDADQFDIQIRRKQQLGHSIVPQDEITLAEYVELWWEFYVIYPKPFRKHSQ